MATFSGLRDAVKIALKSAFVAVVIPQYLSIPTSLTARVLEILAKGRPYVFCFCLLPHPSVLRRLVLVVQVVKHFLRFQTAKTHRMR